MKSNQTQSTNPHESDYLTSANLETTSKFAEVRLSFLALFFIVLLRVKTVNLVELATGFRNNGKTESSYKRLQRFFASFDWDYSLIAKTRKRNVREG